MKVRAEMKGSRDANKHFYKRWAFLFCSNIPLHYKFQIRWEIYSIVKSNVSWADICKISETNKFKLNRA